MESRNAKYFNVNTLKENHLFIVELSTRSGNLKSRFKMKGWQVLLVSSGQDGKELFLLNERVNGIVRSLHHAGR